MELLIYLAERHGQVVGSDELITGLWAGKLVTSSSLYNCVAELRQALTSHGDAESYIDTIPKRGYRLVAPVSGLPDDENAFVHSEDDGPSAARSSIPYLAAGLLALLVFGLIAAYIVRDEDHQQPTPTAAAEVTESSIAVLPFKDLSAEGDQAYFSEGLAEEILNTLAHIANLRVISRSSSFALGEEKLTGPEIAARLNVAYVLEGSVRKEGDRVRVTAQLIDAASDSHVWSEAYDRSIQDVFAIQNEIAGKVAEALKIQVLGAPRVESAFQPQAFELYLQGRYQVARRQRDNLQRAEALFLKAIDLDPVFAPAYAGLAKALYLQSSRGDAAGPELVRRARKAVDVALQLDRRNAEALATLGLMTIHSDPEGGRQFLEEAIANSPSDSDAYRWLALSYEQTDPLRYLELMRKAFVRDPLNESLNFHRVSALLALARIDEARDANRQWHEQNLGFGGPYMFEGALSRSRGDVGRALKCYFAAYRLDPDWDVPADAASRLFTDLNLLELAEQWSMAAWNEFSGDASDSDFAVRQRILIMGLRGDQAGAARLIDQTASRYPGWTVMLGRAQLLLGADFERARDAWERGWTEYGGGMTSEWGVPETVDYALLLQRTGMADQAAALIDQADRLVEGQLQAGMARYGSWRSLDAGPQFYQAVIHALRGDQAQAVSALRKDVVNGSVSCPSCLRIWPHFDAVRDDPGIETFVAEQEAEATARRDRLERAGLLLSPEKVLELEKFDFDPFADAPD